MSHLTTKWAPIIINQNTIHVMTIQNLSGFNIGSRTLTSFSGA